MNQLQMLRMCVLTYLQYVRTSKDYNTVMYTEDTIMDLISQCIQ